VIVPPAESIPAAVAERLKAFHDAGGIVVAIGRLPVSSCNGQEDDRVRAAVKAVWGTEEEKQPRSAVADYAALESVLTSLDVPDVRIPSQPKLLYCHRQLHGKDLYFFANTGKEPIAPTIELRGVRGVPMLWNPVGGEIAEARNYTAENDVLKLSQPFGEYESLFVVIDPEAKPRAEIAAKPTEEKRIMFTGPWKVKKGADEFRRVFTAEIRVPADWPVGASTRLDLEGASQILRVKVNGRAVGEKFCSPYRFEIGKDLQVGDNTIEIERVGRYTSPAEVQNMGGLSFTEDATAPTPCARALLITSGNSP
jgi:hypothetical protein